MKISENQEITIDGSTKKIVIVLPYFNQDLGMKLLENVVAELNQNKVQKENITLTRVFGSLEVPFACKKIIQQIQPHVIIALGVIIRGKTDHYELVTQNTYQGIMKLQLESNIPIIFGVVTADNVDQAKQRIDREGLNKGKDFAQAALIQSEI